MAVRDEINAQDGQLLQQIAAAIQRADLKTAALSADAARSRGLRHPLIHTAHALWLSSQERHEQALFEFSQVETMSPPTAALRSAMGVCLAKLGRTDEAVAAFDAALALQPNTPQFHMRKGWAHELQGELESARRAHERAVELNADYAEALGRLAYLATRRGDIAAARAYAERALALDVQQTSAQLALATTEIEDRAYAAAELRLGRLMSSKQVIGNDRYVCLGLMGDLFDRQGRIAEAYAYYEKANDVGRNLPGSTSGHNTMLEVVRGLSDYMRTVPGQHPPAPIPPVAETQRHVFVLGFPRSGTTLLEQVLACHPDVVTLEEKDTLTDAVRAFMGRPQDLEKLWAADEPTLARQRALYWQRVRSFGATPDGKFFVDKTPINTIYLPLIVRIFPQAKIVFALRDPRDVVLSCFRRRFKANALSSEFVTLQRTAQFYDGVMGLAELYRAKLAVELYHLRHESLVDHFELQLRRLCDHLGLTWTDSFWNFADQSKTRGVTTPSSIQLIRGLNSEGIGQWRHYSEQIATVLPLLTPWVRRFGYPTD